MYMYHGPFIEFIEILINFLFILEFHWYFAKASPNNINNNIFKGQHPNKFIKL